MTQLGIDVSEHNGEIDWKKVAEEGIGFAIIRAGYGSAYLDSQFYENVNGAHDAGLKLGIYHFGYARTEGELDVEKDFLLSILKDCGLTPNLLPIGVFWDVEEDSYRGRTFPSSCVIHRMCRRFCEARVSVRHLLQCQLASKPHQSGGICRPYTLGRPVVEGMHRKGSGNLAVYGPSGSGRADL